MAKLFSPKISLIIFLFIFLIFFISNAVPYIYSDGYGSYHTTQCILKEFKWACENQPDYFPDHSAHGVSFYRDKYSTVYSPGSAIVNLPFQAAAQVLNGDKTMFNDRITATNGHTLFEALGFLFTASILSVISVILQYKSLRLLKFSEKHSILAVAVGYISSYAIWYALLNHAFNHSTEVFALSLFVYSFLKATIEKTYIGKWWIVVGISIGLAVISRPTLGIIVLPMIVYLLNSELWLKKSIKVVIGGLPFLLILISYNYYSYGEIFASGYSHLFNQNFQFHEWNGFNILVSKYRGWFIYSPAMLFAVAFLLKLTSKSFSKITTAYTSIFKNRENFLYFLSLWMIFGTVFIYGFWPMWWGGGSYGQRFLLATLPFTNIGIALFIKSISKQTNKNLQYGLAAILAVFTLWSGIFTVLYRFTPVAELVPKEKTTTEISSADQYTPLDIINYQVDLFKNSSSISNYLSNFLNSASGGGNFLTLLPVMGNAVFWIDDNLVDNEVNTLFFDNHNLLKGYIEVLWYENGKDPFNFILSARMLDPEGALLSCSYETLVCSYGSIPSVPSETIKMNEVNLDEWTGFRVMDENNNEINIYLRATDEGENIYFKGNPIK